MIFSWLLTLCCALSVGIFRDQDLKHKPFERICISSCGGTWEHSQPGLLKLYFLLWIYFSFFWSYRACERRPPNSHSQGSFCTFCLFTQSQGPHKHTSFCLRLWGGPFSLVSVTFQKFRRGLGFKTCLSFMQSL